MAAYDAVYQSTEAGLAIAEPGRTTGDVWQTMWSVLERTAHSATMWVVWVHRLGMQLTRVAITCPQWG